MAGVIYPVAASWVWGGGWLSGLGFKDFAGSGVVHLVGGFGGMIGTIILGPRLNFFEREAEKQDEMKKRTKRRAASLEHAAAGSRLALTPEGDELLLDTLLKKQKKYAKKSVLAGKTLGALERNALTQMEHHKRA